MRSSLWRLALVGGCLSSCDDDTDRPDVGPADSGITTTCPTHLRFTFVEGSRTDVGWTGNTHASTIPRDAFFRVRVVRCDEECRSCDFEGPVRDEVVNTQRCVSDPAQSCTEDSQCEPWECRDLFAGTSTVGPVFRCAQDSSRPCTVPEDCGPSACRFFVGPPFPILAPQVCLGTYMEDPEDPSRNPVRGNIDLVTGAVRNFDLGIVSAATNDQFQGACPRCEGDRMPNDGQADGTCMQNTVTPAFPYNAGQACDANGVGQPERFAGNYSLDCTTPLGVRIPVGMAGGSTDGRTLRLTSGVQPECDEGELCWCGVCEGTDRACHDATDCELGVPCVEPSSENITIRPNSCIDDCVWDPVEQRGACLTQDRAGPDGMLPEPRMTSCFPEGSGASIRATGSRRLLSPTSYSVQIGQIECRPAVQSVFPGPVSVETDEQVGLPGPQLNVFRFQIDQEFEP